MRRSVRLDGLPGTYHFGLDFIKAIDVFVKEKCKKIYIKQQVVYLSVCRSFWV